MSVRMFFCLACILVCFPKASAFANKHKVRVATLPPPSKACVVRLRKLSWYDMGYLTADRTSLERMYRLDGYQKPHPTRTMMLATRVVPGVGQPAFQLYSIGNTAFRYSHGNKRWWPASCVKPWTVAAAMMTLRKYGLNGRSKLTFRDVYGTFRGTLWNLYIDISNQRYDRMMMIAGLDAVNSPAWRKKYSLPHTILQRPYGGIRTLRYSPKIYYNHRGRKGVIPARVSKIQLPRTCRSNCTTLFELQDVIRRFCLHKELPRSERFNITDDDAKRFKRALLLVPNKMGRAFRKVFGRRSKGYNKSGSARGLDQIENVFIEPQRDPYRYLIAASVPWWRKDYMADPSLLILNELGRRTMLALKKLTTRRVSIQADAGPPMRVQLFTQDANRRIYTLRVHAPGIDRIVAWHRLTRVRMKQVQPGLFEGNLPLRVKKKTLFVFKGYKDKKAIAYKSIGAIFPPNRPICRPIP